MGGGENFGYVCHAQSEMEGSAPLRAARARPLWAPAVENEAEAKRPVLACVLQPRARRVLAAGGGHFPFPREKGSEKGSWQSVAGVARKPDFFLDVWLEVLLARGAPRAAQAPKSGSHLKPKGILRGMFLAPFSPF